MAHLQTFPTGTLVAVPDYPGAATYTVGTITGSSYEYHHGHGEEVTIFTLDVDGQQHRLTFQDLAGAVVLPRKLGAGLVEAMADYSLGNRQ